MKLKIAICIVLLAFVSACGGGGGGNASSSSSKSIFALWTKSNNTFSFDITGQSFGSAFPVDFLLTTGEICACTGFVIGNESAGTISVTNCSYVSGGAGNPNCANLWQNSGQAYNYTKASVSLSLCDHTSTCYSYY